MHRGLLGLNEGLIWHPSVPWTCSYVTNKTLKQQGIEVQFQILERSDEVIAGSNLLLAALQSTCSRTFEIQPSHFPGN